MNHWLCMYHVFFFHSCWPHCLQRQFLLTYNKYWCCWNTTSLKFWHLHFKMLLFGCPHLTMFVKIASHPFTTYVSVCFISENMCNDLRSETEGKVHDLVQDHKVKVTLNRSLTTRLLLHLFTWYKNIACRFIKCVKNNINFIYLWLSFI